MKVAALALVALTAPAFADATVPASTPPASRNWILDEGPITHEPVQTLPLARTRTDVPPPVKQNDPPRARSGTYENAKCPDPDAQPSRPLDFVDATLETGDLSSRYSSSRPVVKQVPAPRHTKPLGKP
jgi:hypothetical protein